MKISLFLEEESGFWGNKFSKIKNQEKMKNTVVYPEIVWNKNYDGYPIHTRYLVPMFQEYVMDLENSGEKHVRIVTMSEHIINHVGLMIAREQIDCKKVFIFLQDKNENRVVVKTPRYIENGTLRKWPFDWFYPVY